MIGIDTVRVSRIKKAIERDVFKNRVFTAREQAYCDGAACPEQSYAAMFCAKEAAVKALKCGFGRGVMPIDIEITHDENGAPHLTMRGHAEELRAGRCSDVSVSHDGDYAVAVVELSEL